LRREVPVDSLIAFLTILLFSLAGVPVGRLWRSRVAALLAGSLAAFGLLVVGLQLLGVLAAVTGRPVVTGPNALGVSALLCAASWFILWRRASVLRRSEGLHQKRHSPKLRLGAQRDLRVLLVVLIVCCAFLAIAVASGLSGPPRHWDVLTYHLPRTAGWLLHGDLAPYGSTGAFYPANAELLSLVLFFSGSDRLVPLVQLPFALLAALAIYAIGRKLGASISSASIGLLVFLAAPIVFFQTTIAKNDLFVTAFVLCFVFFYLRSLDNRVRGGDRIREVAAAGFALGLAIGTKYSIFPFAIVAIPLVLIFQFMVPGREEPLSRSEVLGTAGVFAAALAVPSAFWFLRNLALTGNPVAPLSMGIGDWVSSSGLSQEFQFVTARAYWFVFPMMDTHVGSTYSGSAGFGAAFAALAFPGVVLTIGRALDRGERVVVRAQSLAVVVLIALSIVAWWFGKHHLPRFLLPAMGLVCVTIALVPDAISQKSRAVFLAVVSLAVLFSGLETLRIVFREDDHIWSHQHAASHRAHYRMPGIIYELPVGTRILLLRPTDHNFYQTFRYPLVGSLPGNDVVMGDDVGLGLDITYMSGPEAHAALLQADIDYLFMRTIGLRPFRSPLDELPHLFEQVVDTVELSYPWYRESTAIAEDGTVLGRGTVVTKMYRVRRDVPTGSTVTPPGPARR
jgi:hypothetical protein